MPRDYKRITISDVLNVDMDSISILKNNKEAVENFRQIVKKGADYAQRRYVNAQRVIDRKGLPTPLAYKQGANIFKILNTAQLNTLDYSQLVEQYTYIRNFLESKTSTVSGWEKHLRNFSKTFTEKLEDRYNIKTKINPRNYQYFWELYKAAEGSAIQEGKVNYEVYRAVGEVLNEKPPEEVERLIKNNEWEELVNAVKEKSRDIYEEDLENEDIDEEETFLMEQLYGKKW